MLLLLAGCLVVPVQFPPDLAGDVPRDSGWDTGAAPVGERFGMLRADTLSATCSSTESLALAVRTRGWAERLVAVVVDESGSAVEEHPLVRTEVDPFGTFEVYQLGPLRPADGTYQAGVTSSMPCRTDPHAVSVAVLSYGRVDGLVDCITFGEVQTRLGEALAARADARSICRIIQAGF